MNRLDLIIAALQRVELLFEAHGQYPHTLREVSEALAAARELQALKPVAWQFFQDGKWHNGFDTHNHRGNTEEAGFPVRDIYALDEVTK